MAKKTVATLQNNSRRVVKLIKCVKTKKGGYAFKSEYAKPEDLDKIYEKK